jgi:hypothetical protein
MLCRVILVRTDVSEEHFASIIRVKLIGKLGTALAVTATKAHCNDGGDKFLQNVVSKKSHMASHPRRWRSGYLVVSFFFYVVFQ